MTATRRLYLRLTAGSAVRVYVHVGRARFLAEQQTTTQKQRLHDEMRKG